MSDKSLPRYNRDELFKFPGRSDEKPSDISEESADDSLVQLHKGEPRDVSDAAPTENENVHAETPSGTEPDWRRFGVSTPDDQTVSFDSDHFVETDDEPPLSSPALTPDGRVVESTALFDPAPGFTDQDYQSAPGLFFDDTIDPSPVVFPDDDSGNEASGEEVVRDMYLERVPDRPAGPENEARWSDRTIRQEAFDDQLDGPALPESVVDQEDTYTRPVASTGGSDSELPVSDAFDEDLPVENELDGFARDDDDEGNDHEDTPSPWKTTETDTGGDDSVTLGSTDPSPVMASNPDEPQSTDTVASPKYSPLIELSDPTGSIGGAAFRTASKAVEQYNEDPDAPGAPQLLFHAAEQFQIAGLPGKARGLFEQFIAAYPTHQNVGDARRAISSQHVDTPSEDQIVGGRKRLLDSLQESRPATPVSTPTLNSVIGSGKTIKPAPAAVPVVPRPKGSVRTIPLGSDKDLDYPSITPAKSRSAFGAIVQRWGTRNTILASVGLVLLAILFAFWALSARGFYGPEVTEPTPTSSPRPSVTQQATPPPGGIAPSSSSTTGQEASSGSTESASVAPTPSEQPLLVANGADLIPEDGGFGLQVKYTLSKSEADAISARYRARGFRVGVVRGPNSGFRVVVGQYPGIDQARSSKSKLPDFAPKDAYPVDINQYK